MKKKKVEVKPVINNLVAKHARTFNHACMFDDKKKKYRRNAKHRGSTEPYLIGFFWSQLNRVFIHEVPV